MGLGGLRNLLPGSGKQTIRIQYVRLSSVARKMPIAKYCPPSQQSTKKAPPFHREGTILGSLMVVNPDMSLGQKSTRDGVLLGSLEIAGLPRGDWQIIPN